MIKDLAKRFFLTFVLLLLYAPVVILLLYSVNNAKFSLQWQGFSSRWYQELFQDRALWAAFFNSVMLGLCASLLATFLGFMACVSVFLSKRKQRNTLFTLLLLLVIVPDLVLGVSLLIFFNLSKIPLGFFSLLIAHITFCIPFVVLTINARIKTLDPNLYYSALDLGASRYLALTRILLPLLWPAVLSAILLSFTMSFDDVIISYFVSGPDFNILPLTIYSLVRAGVTPELNALCSMTLLLSMVLIIMAHRVSRKTP